MKNKKELISDIAASGDENAAGQIAGLFHQPPYISDDELLTHAILAVKKLPGGASAISKIIELERDAFQRGEMHEDLAIKTLQEIGGEEAASALSDMLGFIYRTKALIALATIDASNSPEEIC